MPAPVASPSPALLVAPAAPASTVTGFRGTVQYGDGSYYRSGHEGSDFVLEKTEGGFRLRLRIEEPDTVEFSRDGSEIVRMGRRASVLIRTSTDDAWQRLDVTRDSDGDLRYDWTVNGERRDFDDQARVWMSVALQVAHGLRQASELRGAEIRVREVKREIVKPDAEVRVREVKREIVKPDAEVRVREVKREIEKVDVKVLVREIVRKVKVLDADHRADPIDRRTRPLYDELRRLSRRLD
jgi:hypothetical protein